MPADFDHFLDGPAPSWPSTTDKFMLGSLEEIAPRAKSFNQRGVELQDNTRNQVDRFAPDLFTTLGK